MPLKKFAAAYDALPIGVAVINSELRVEAWNATLAKWSRTTANQAIARTLVELFPGLRVDRFGLRLDAVFTDNQSVVLSSAMHQQILPLQTADGGPLFHKSYASPAPGWPGSALVVLEDVTTTVVQLNMLRSERKRLQASERSLRQQWGELEAKNKAIEEAHGRAEAANLAKSEFLANMSHEIRTPLTAIKGFAEILVDHCHSDFAIDAAGRITRNGDHLLAIVNDILDLSKIEAGKLALRPELCSPVRLTEDICQSLMTRATAKGVALAIESTSGAESPIHVDPMRLRQILLNLIDNAVKFTHEGSVTVEFARADEPGMVRFSVRDTGVGIDPQKIQTIFQPFVQEDTTSRRKYGGTGLGLAITRQLVRQMQGRMTVRTELGAGSTFTVLIPVGEVATKCDAVASEAGTKETPVAVPTSEAAPLKGRRVLVAEDGPDNQYLIEYLVTKAGADVVMVENGQQAVEAVRGDETFDVIVLDMQMPVVDGYTAATTLRHLGIATPIVALTAHAMAGDRDKALSAGCDDYVAKPIDAEGFIGLLAELAPAVRSDASRLVGAGLGQ